METKGFINSIQTLGTLDGPGVRFTVFLQGCNLRCGCCHNPETWEIGKGTTYTPTEILEKATKYKEYFGKQGGITLSGGEPLIQAKFAKEVFELCKKNNINTCIDTSGSIINEDVISLLDYTDYILLDIKYNSDELYEKYVGCSINTPLEFLKLAQSKGISVILRQVLIPTLNDNDENIQFLNNLARKHSTIIKLELLPFKKLCKTKYDDLKIPFRFENIPEPTKEETEKFSSKLKT